MFDFHEKRKIRGLVYSPVTILVLVILSAFLSVSVYERFKVERDVAQKRAEKEEELLRLKDRAAALEGDIEHLQSERGIEEELRSRFDIAKEGEQVIILVGDEESDLQKATVNRRKEEGSVIKKIVDFIKFWE